MDFLAALLPCCRVAPLWSCASCEGSCKRERDIHAAACFDGLSGADQRWTALV